MDVILKQDVENLGFKDDVVSVKNGFGRNYLIPQGFAILATGSAKKDLAEDLRQRAHKEAKMVDAATKTSEALRNVELKIEAKAGLGGKLFGAITNQDVADRLTNLGHHIDKKFIQIAGGSIKVSGKNSAKIRLHRDVVIDFHFEVIPSEA